MTAARLKTPFSMLLPRAAAENGYYQTTYYKDILERYDIRAEETLSSMMRHAVDQAGEMFSISPFTKTLTQRSIECSKRTGANYFTYLEEAFYMILIEKFACSQRQRTANQAKCYLFDAGFQQLAVNFSPNKGKLLENLVAIELRRRGRVRLHHHERRAPRIVDSGVLGNSREEPPKGNGRFSRGAERIEFGRGVDPEL